MNAHSKMVAARTALILEQPFFGSLALSLTLKSDPGCETAWVDGRTLGFDPQFVDSLTHAQCTALVAHEVMHCAMGHPWRRDARNSESWNVACDKSINHELRESGFTLPPDAYYPEHDEKGKSSEWYYSHGQEEKDGDNGNGKGQGNPNGQGKAKPDPLGELRDAPTGPDENGEDAPTEQEWKQKTAEALQQAKMQGKIPAGLARQVGQALKPTIDIRSLLLRFFSERSTGDFSWSRPNPRFIALGAYLPALESRALGEIALMVDTSGSVDQVSLDYARGILESVIDECDPLGVTLYFSDAEVCHVQRMEKGEPLTWEPKGGGGTDFRPVLEAIETDGNAVCAVCITDLEGTLPDVPPSFPTLWLCTTDLIAPFGETVPIDR
jgi:predicted metal-dependent peptidase